jgi:WD40 repeat protein
MWSSVNGVLLHTFEKVGDSYIDLPLVFLENGYLASSIGQVKIWDIINNKLKFTLNKTKTCQKDDVTKLAPLKNGLMASSDCNDIKIWNITDGRLKYTFNKTNGGHNKSIDSLVSLKQPNLLASNDFDDIRIWDLDDFKFKYLFPDGGIAGIASLDNGLLGSGSYGLKIWNTNNGKLKHTFHEFQFMHYVNSMTSLSKNNYLVTGYQDGQIKVWDIDHLILKFIFRNAHYFSVDHLVALVDGNLISVGEDINFNTEIKLWDMNYGKLLKTIQSNIDIQVITLLDNGYLVTGSRNGTIQIYEN